MKSAHQSRSSKRGEPSVVADPKERGIAAVGIALIAVAALAAYRAGGFIRYPFGDGDLFWQRQLGEYVLAHHTVPHALGTDVFSAPGAPWVPQEWLFSTFVAIAWNADALWSIAVVSGLLAFAALAIGAWSAVRAGAPPNAVTIVAVLAAICISPSFDLRAEVWVWPLFALALFALEADGPILWWLVPITVLWANLHASVMIVVPIVWLNTAIYAWKSRDNSPNLRTRLLLCVAVPLATLCTPFGVGLPIYAIELLHSPLRAYISEWRPIPIGNISIRFGFLPLVALLMVALFRRVWSTRTFEVGLSLALGVLALFSTRYTVLFAFTAMVPASLALAGAFGARTFFERRRYSTMFIAAALIVVVPLFGWFGIRFGSPGIQWPGPFGSVKRLAALPGEHRLFCAEYSWCSVALAEPNVRIFLDGRADPYPARVWAAHAEITHARPGWQQLMVNYDMNSIIAWRGGFFESRMQTLSQWKEITDTDDPCCVLFIRTTSKRRP